MDYTPFMIPLRFKLCCARLVRKSFRNTSTFICRIYRISFNREYKHFTIVSLVLLQFLFRIIAIPINFKTLILLQSYPILLYPMFVIFPVIFAYLSFIRISLHKGRLSIKQSIVQSDVTPPPRNFKKLAFSFNFHLSKSMIWLSQGKHVKCDDSCAPI